MRLSPMLIAASLFSTATGCPCEEPPETPPANTPTAPDPEAVEFTPPADPAPAGAERVPTQLSVSMTHACARASDDTAHCWGDNGWGELGEPGARGVVRVPVEDVVEVRAGYGFTCVRKRDRTVHCLGLNNLGQTGSSPSELPIREPTQVPGLTDVAQIAAAQNFACALLGDGSAKCWGENQYGLLGTGGGPEPSGPAPVRRVSSGTQISAADATCVVRGDRSVWCWGTNLTDFADPLPVTDVVQVDMGYGGCARRTEGSVWCWGFNESGQLGGETSPDWQGPRRVEGVSGATDVAAGVSFACAVHEGQLSCWGAEWGLPEMTDDCRMETHNTSGGHGGSAAQWHYCPRPMVAPGLADVTEVEAGGRQACAITGGRVFCWGSPEASGVPTGVIDISGAAPDASARTSILQLVLDLPALNPFWHADVAGRSPLRILGNEHVPEGIALRKHGAPVQRIARAEGAYFEVTRLAIEGTRATVEFRYPVEGVVGQATLELGDEGWRVAESSVSER